MWKLEYNQEASNYALDSYPYNEDVLIAIEALALTEEGLPPDLWTELEAEYYLWQVAHHIVMFRRIVGKESIIRILVIKPVD